MTGTGKIKVLPIQPIDRKENTNNNYTYNIMKKRLYILLLIFSVSLQINAQEAEKKLTVPADSLIKKSLEDILIKDQTLRLILPDIEKKFGKDSEELKYIWVLIKRQDSINEVQVIEILDNNGWVGTSRIGSKANQALWLVIQHSSLVIQEKYLPLLEESVLKNESPGWHLAFLKDRILMRNKKKQFYGTQAVYNKESGKYEIYPIEDPKNVDDRRKKIGLETMEEYAGKNGYIYHGNE